MSSNRWIDFSVGAFLILGLAVFFFLATITGSVSDKGDGGYSLNGRFEDVSGLAKNSVVRLSGVITVSYTHLRAHET